MGFTLRYDIRICETGKGEMIENSKHFQLYNG